HSGKDKPPLGAAGALYYIGSKRLEQTLIVIEAYGCPGPAKVCSYGANIRTNRMILLSNNITDNLFVQ
ncbi:MAG: hypothetical protein WBN08_07710, partial [Thiogranum sp.]